MGLIWEISAHFSDQSSSFFSARLFWKVSKSRYSIIYTILRLFRIHIAKMDSFANVSVTRPGRPSARPPVMDHRLSNWFVFQYFSVHRLSTWFVFQYFSVHRLSNWFLFQYFSVHRLSKWILFQYFQVQNWIKMVPFGVFPVSQVISALIIPWINLFQPRFQFQH